MPFTDEEYRAHADLSVQENSKFYITRFISACTKSYSAMDSKEKQSFESGLQAKAEWLGITVDQIKFDQELLDLIVRYEQRLEISRFFADIKNAIYKAFIEIDPAVRQHNEVFVKALDTATEALEAKLCLIAQEILQDRRNNVSLLKLQ